MSIFDRFFKEEQKPVAAIGGDAPAQPVEAVGGHATTKLKLNFKRLPKKVLQAIADQTTGQMIVRKEDEAGTQKRPGSLSDIFNAAARDITDRRDDHERRLAALMTRAERAQAASARPRAPTPSFG